MSDKKNIDSLFKEKLKNFEATPSDSVWENISIELDSIQKGKKGTPIWWRVAGAAAVLLLLFTISQLISDENSITPSQEIIVGDDTRKDPLNTDLENVNNNEKSISNSGEINDAVSVRSNGSNSIPNSPIANTVTNNNLSSVKGENTIANSDDTRVQKGNSNTSNIKNNELVVSSKNQTKNTIVSNTKKENASEIYKNELKTPYSNQTENAIANNANSDLSKEKNQDNNIDKAKIEDLLNIPLNNSSETNGAIKTRLTEDAIQENIPETEESSLAEEHVKLSLTEEIAVNEEDAILDETKEEFERWKVASYIAPVYFNSIGEGSSIHPQFDNNSKSGDINMSYGVSGSYAINKRLSVRSGINKVKLGYSTNDAIIIIDDNSPTNPQLLRNAQVNAPDQNLSFINVAKFNFAQIPGVLSNNIDGSIDQKLGFIEIPLELEYKISDRKMGINIIGGFSTLFLNENEIYSVFDGNTILLGKATNINKTSFSANFGLGFDFKISDKFNLNLEPVFKYQLNTFNNTSGNFKPYFIGIYSGLSFKF